MRCSVEHVEGGLSIIAQHGEEHVQVYVCRDEHGEPVVIVKEWTLGSQEQTEYRLEDES